MQIESLLLFKTSERDVKLMRNFSKSPVKKSKKAKKIYIEQNQLQIFNHF